MQNQRAFLRFLLAATLAVAGASLGQGGLATRFATEVDGEAPLPEHPRPQWMRESWLSLNGPWSYAVGEATAEGPTEAQGRLLVPFPIESRLSGVGRMLAPNERLWCWRRFRLELSPARERALLHFGAVDWECEVWVDGQRVGEHRGGYDPFTLEIGWALDEGTEHELMVAVWDPTDAGTQPRGKQVLQPGGIWYTPTSGIWQSVWIERVPTSYLMEPDYLPRLLEQRLDARLRVAGWGDGMRVVARASLHGGVVARAESDLPLRDGSLLLELELPEVQPWTPDDPVLYDLVLELWRGDKRLDSVASYFGMRSIEVDLDLDGKPRIFLNGKRITQLGLLDQGFWPDGLYTAPTDEALRYDIEVAKALGFNMLRKHVKVEPDRWYSWCDRLGVLVWQDMPSGGESIGPDQPDLERDAQAVHQYGRELCAIVDALGNHPSIVTWVPFNEGWGQFDTAEIARLLRERDASRVIDAVSGWADRGVGDLIDAHVYPGPGLPPPASPRAAVLGEFGGLGLPLSGHTWQSEANWGYRSYPTREALCEAYERLVEDLPFLVGEGLCAAVYTQLTDVESEVNGLMTYDRAVIKPTAERVRGANARALRPPPRMQVLLPSSESEPQRWRYRLEKPGDTWFLAGFDDGAWSTGPGGFGRPATPGAVVGTRWTSEDIWLRQSFQLAAVPRAPVGLWIHHDEDAEVYLNGTLVATLPGYRTGYGLVRLGRAASQDLRAGANLIAVHCRQTGGGQFIDVGLVELPEESTAAGR